MHPLAILSLFLGKITLSAATRAGNRGTDIMWSSLAASDNVVWQVCPGLVYWQEWECMRFEVPLDYDNDAAGTTTIAFIKHKAAEGSQRHDTKDILYNPGGPGVSGTAFLERNIKAFRRILGDKDLNLIAFDPRGVGHSGPSIDCFLGDDRAASRADWDIFLDPANSADADTETFERAGQWGDLCQQNLDHTANYIGTAAVARDMLTFVERQAIFDNQDMANAKLNFMGASYGTTLGATFATLFPDRVGRMILDGIASGEDYYGGKRDTWLPDADNVFKQFFRQCHAAESSGCAFWGVSPSAIQNRFERLLQALRVNPVELPYTKLPLDEPILLTEGCLRALVYAYAGSGHTEFRNLAVTLAAVEGFEKGSSPIHEDFLKSKIWPWLVPPPCSRCSEQDLAVLRKDFNDMSAGTYFGTFSIRCTDADGRFIISSVEHLKEHVSASRAKSRYVGDWAGVLPAVCRKWPFRPPPS